MDHRKGKWALVGKNLGKKICGIVGEKGLETDKHANHERKRNKNFIDFRLDMI